jgi:hypothetical protein
MDETMTTPCMIDNCVGHIDNDLHKFIIYKCDHSTTKHNGCDVHNQLCMDCMAPFLGYHGVNACGECIDNLYASPYECWFDNCNNPTMFDDGVCIDCNIQIYNKQIVYGGD